METCLNCKILTFKTESGKYNYNDKVKEDEMRVACSTQGGYEECISNFGGRANSG
jgi:hypothetical protein